MDEICYAFYKDEQWETMNYPRHPVSFVIGQTSGILIGCYLFFDTVRFWVAALY